MNGLGVKPIENGALRINPIRLKSINTTAIIKPPLPGLFISLA
jgi:hypothetical protein